MKIKPTLLDWEFIGEMAKRMTAGQEKHPDVGGVSAYLSMPEQDLADGLLRHVQAYASGEELDEDHQSHLVAIACRAMMIWKRQGGLVTCKCEFPYFEGKNFYLSRCSLSRGHYGAHGQALVADE